MGEIAGVCFTILSNIGTFGVIVSGIVASTVLWGIIAESFAIVSGIVYLT